MIKVGNFCIAGDWDTSPTPNGSIRLVIPPPTGHVFGAGWHSFTHAALRAVAAHVRSGQSFLDVGTGTGILSVAAARLGADPVVAVEVDPLAIAAARRTFAANGVNVELVKAIPERTFDLAFITVGSAQSRDLIAGVSARRVVIVEDDESITVMES